MTETDLAITLRGPHLITEAKRLALSAATVATGILRAVQASSCSGTSLIMTQNISADVFEEAKAVMAVMRPMNTMELTSFSQQFVLKADSDTSSHDHAAFILECDFEHERFITTIDYQSSYSFASQIWSLTLIEAHIERAIRFY